MFDQLLQTTTMKKREGYEFSFNEDRTEFRFESVGPKGTIVKIVKFSQASENLFNLAFGDADSIDFNDESISNNQDMRKVMATIANIVRVFVLHYQNVRIVVIPVDQRRKLLYNRIFQQYSNEILESYSIEAYFLNPRGKEAYTPSKIYDAFVLVPEKPIFEL
jgi:hypothetical protein